MKYFESIYSRPPPKDIPQRQFFLRAGRVLKSGSQFSCLKILWTFLLFFCLGFPVWKDFEYFTVVSVWDPHLKRLWKFYDFSCLKILWILHDFLNLKSPPEKTLKISWFFLSEIPVWKLFEYFMISHVWNPRLKRLWIFFFCLNSLSEKTFNIL